MRVQGFCYPDPNTAIVILGNSINLMSILNQSMGARPSQMWAEGALPQINTLDENFENRCPKSPVKNSACLST